MFNKEILCLQAKIGELVPLCELTHFHILNKNVTFS